MADIKVLVVDDSVVIRRMVTNVLSEDPDITVVGTASNGQIGLEKIELLKPDLVTLDIEMPVLDGIGTLKAIRKLYPRLPVIMFSTLTEQGARTTLDALALGASDYVTKPANMGSIPAAMEAVREQLVPKIRALTGRRQTPRPVSGQTSSSITTPLPAKAAARVRPPGLIPTPEVLVIGSSTGGPDALLAVIPKLPADFPLPIAIVQHMPPVFTKMLAQRLDLLSKLEVREAVNGDVVRRGQVLIAPGDYHLELRREGMSVKAFLQQGPPENFCRPAVDVMFRSAAEAYGGRILALIMTGMGHDGAQGAGVISGKGGYVLAQDEQSSVVWGMPGAVSDAGFADEVLPLTEIVAGVLRNSSSVIRFHPAQPKSEVTR